MYELGALFGGGYCFFRDETKQEELYRRALPALLNLAQKGNAKAQYYIACMDCEGWKGNYWENKDKEKWLRKSAQGGYAEAQSTLAHFLHERCYPRDSNNKIVAIPEKEKSRLQKESFKLFLAAASQDEISAVYPLYCCYKEGWGTTRNLYEAMKWLCYGNYKNDWDCREGIFSEENQKLIKKFGLSMKKPSKPKS